MDVAETSITTESLVYLTNVCGHFTDSFACQWEEHLLLPFPFAMSQDLHVLCECIVVNTMFVLIIFKEGGGKF